MTLFFVIYTEISNISLHCFFICRYTIPARSVTKKALHMNICEARTNLHKNKHTNTKQHKNEYRHVHTYESTYMHTESHTCVLEHVKFETWEVAVFDAARLAHVRHCSGVDAAVTTEVGRVGVNLVTLLTLEYALTWKARTPVPSSANPNRPHLAFTWGTAAE